MLTRTRDHTQIDNILITRLGYNIEIVKQCLQHCNVNA